MGHGHGHGHGVDERYRSSRRTRIVLGLVLAPFAAATLVAILLLWPFERTAKIADQNALGRSENFNAVVTGIDDRNCGNGACTVVRVRLDDGPEAGRAVALEELQPGPATTAMVVGRRVVVTRTELVLEPGVTYQYYGPQRRGSLWLLAGAFVVAVVAVARWRGFAALLGLAFTYWAIVAFVIPAVLNGENPVAVALAGASLVMFVVLYLAHGLNVRTTTALLGTLVSLGLLGGLAWLFVNLTDLSGTATEEVMFIQFAGADLNLRGLLLAGIIIGSMGVLNDVTVTQASAVWEVHRADPTLPVASLYRSGMRVGRDHIASVVDTLVLAYAGASLPLMILFVIGNRKLEEVVTGEIVAEEIVRTLVGSMGLVASVPITTLAAAVIVSRQQPLLADPDPDPDAPTVGASVAAAASGLGRSLSTTAGVAGRRWTERGERRRRAGAARGRTKAAQWKPDRRERMFRDDERPEK